MEEENTATRSLMTRGLNLVGFNIKSLYPKKEQIEHLLENERVGILVLTESWLNKGIPNDAIRIDDYKVYRLDRQRKAKGGGICVYVHTKLKVNALLYSHLNESSKEAEILVLNVQQKCTKSMNVIASYRPPQGNQRRYIQIMKEALKSVSPQEDVFIIGDLNINSLENSKSVKDLKAMEGNFDLKQYIGLPTRVTRKSKSLIDHIYTNSKIVSNHGIIEMSISDHFLTFLTIKKPKTHFERVTFTCRNHKNLNEQTLKGKLQEVNWAEYYELTELEKCWNFLYKKLIEIFDDICPEVTYNNVKKKNEWMTADIFALMRERENKFKIARQVNTEESWLDARKSRNVCNSACKEAKNNIVKAKLSETAGNTRKFWESLKPLISEDNSGEDNRIELSNLNGEPDEASAFNKYFTGIGISLQRDIPELTEPEKAKLVKVELPQQSSGKHGKRTAKDRNSTTKPKFKFRRILDIEIENIVKKIEIHKSSGIPRLSSYLIKLSFRIIIQQLTHLMNMIVDKIDIPSQWKQAVVTPVFKAGCPGAAGNYRPISTLPTTTKILEKCIHTQLSQYLESNSLLSDKQYGFRKGRSTEKAISKLLTDLLNSFNKSQYSKICYIDLKKAFDTVSHPILLDKMQSLGITGEENRWFEVYLTDRTQRVKVNGTVSGTAGITCMWRPAG